MKVKKAVSGGSPGVGGVLSCQEGHIMIISSWIARIADARKGAVRKRIETADS